MIRKLIVSLVLLVSVNFVFALAVQASPIANFDNVDEVSVIGQTGYIHIGSFNQVYTWVGTYVLNLDFEPAYNAYDGTYNGYCIEDTWAPSNKGNYALYDAEGSFNNYEAAAYLFNRYGTSVSSNAERAGLQLAIWESVFDYGSYNLAQGQGQGNFYVYDGYLSSAITYANTYLYSLTSFDPNTFNASGYGLVSDDNPLSLEPENYQDYIIANPIPEPRSMMLLGSLAIGLFGFAGLRKRFKK